MSAHPVSLCLSPACVCVCVCTCVCAHVCVRVPFPGDLSPPHEHTCLSDEDKQRGGAQVGVAQTKDCGTSTDGPCRRGHAPVTTGTRAKPQDRQPPPPPPPPHDSPPAPLPTARGGAGATPTHTPARRPLTICYTDPHTPVREPHTRCDTHTHPPGGHTHKMLH